MSAVMFWQHRQKSAHVRTWRASSTYRGMPTSVWRERMHLVDVWDGTQHTRPVQLKQLMGIPALCNVQLIDLNSLGDCTDSLITAVDSRPRQEDRLRPPR